VIIRYRALSIQHDWGWVLERTNPKLVEDTCGIVAYDVETGEIAAMAIFDHLWSTSATAHILVEHPMVLRHGFIEEAADFIFNFMGKQVLIGQTPSTNVKALKMAHYIGFKEVYRVPNGLGEGKDMVITQLVKEECKHLPILQEGAA